MYRRGQNEETYTNTQRSLLQEILQRTSIKAIENKPIIDEPKIKKKEKTEFQKELKKKRNVVLRKISIKGIYTR